jgi:hypothetical protein
MKYVRPFRLLAMSEEWLSRQYTSFPCENDSGCPYMVNPAHSPLGGLCTLPHVGTTKPGRCDQANRANTAAAATAESPLATGKACAWCFCRSCQAAASSIERTWGRSEISGVATAGRRGYNHTEQREARACHIWRPPPGVPKGRIGR